MLQLRYFETCSIDGPFRGKASHTSSASKEILLRNGVQQSWIDDESTLGTRTLDSPCMEWGWEREKREKEREREREGERQREREREHFVVNARLKVYKYHRKQLLATSYWFYVDCRTTIHQWNSDLFDHKVDHKVPRLCSCAVR